AAPPNRRRRPGGPPQSESASDWRSCSIRGWEPELDPGTQPRLALDRAPSPRQLGPLIESEEAKMARQVVALGNHKALSVVGDGAVDSTVDQLQRHLHGCCTCMLF